MKKLLLTLTVILAFTVTTFAQSIPEGEYVIKFANNPNYVLTLKDGKANNSNPIHLWQWQNNNSQRWKVTHKDGRIVIRSMVDNNYVLDVKGYNYNKGAEVYIYGYHGGNNQLWIPEKQSNGSYVLMTAGNQNFCLDLYNGSATNGNKIELWDAHKGWQEQWIFEKASNMPSGYQLNSKNVPDGKYIIRCANNPDYVVTMKDGCFSDNSVIHISKWRGLDWQKWIVTHKDGKIVFRSVLEPARVINVYVQNGIGNGQYIALYWGDDPAINQLWIPELQSNGTYVLMYGNNKEYSLDLRNGEAIEDGKIQLYETHKGAAQQWILEKIE